MTLNTSLYSGVSGLTASSLDLSVVGDNIANANTMGFKASRAVFEDALSDSLIGGSQLGLGTRLQAIQHLLAQGSLASTGRSTDLAIQGAGFFVVRGAPSGIDGTFYTRAGQFTIDETGYLVNLDGLRVQGTTADDAGAVGGPVGDLALGEATSQPRATANVKLAANLSSDAQVNGAAWDPLDPTGTSNFQNSTVIYDSLGNDHTVDVYFRKNAAGDWEWHALTDGGSLTGGTAGTRTEIASGTLTFDTDGKLVDSTQTSDFNPLDATNPQPLTFDLGTSITAGGTGLDGVTQFAGQSTAKFASQDGYATGDLSGVKVEADGRVTGIFSNGQTRTLAQLAVADFSAPDRLDRVSGNLLVQTASSGEPVLGAASSGGRGAIVAGALEQSNVDISEEFVRMITAQRSFQANSKTITTADQLLAELIQMKR